MSVVSTIKGWIGEKTVQFGMWLQLDDNIYKRYHNVIIQSENGTTQIDHILLSIYGIFVIETKNYNGWIYGGETQKNWTQVLFGKKSQFQNPLHQNYKHTKSLAQYLHVDHRKIYSVIIFIGEDVELKSEFPSNVLTGNLSAYIQKFTKIMFDNSEIKRIENQLNQIKNSQNILSSYKHIKNVKTRYSDNTKCPKCGGELIKRIAKNGPNAGNEFLGCGNFPKCRYVRG